MSTKIVAARLATSAGVTTVITRSSTPGNIPKIVQYNQALRNPAVKASGDIHLSSSISSLDLNRLPNPPLHTRFLPDPHPIRDRYFWLLHGLAPHGTVFIDEGAHRALAGKAGLLPVGVVHAEGAFAQQEAVRLVVVRRRPVGQPHSYYDHGTDTPPTEVGRALVNYSAAEIARIKGVQSTEIQAVLGYADSEYIALRENISFFKPARGSRPVTPSLGSSADLKQENTT